MDQSLRRFARRILLLHLAALLPLLAVVFIATREVYWSAQQQATEQAERQQELLVGQTASGLKGYYDSLFGDLDLFKPVAPDDEDADNRIPLDEVGDQPSGTWRNFRINPMLPVQLNGRVAHLFIMQKGTHLARPYGKQGSNPTVAQVVERSADWIDGLDRASISPLQQFGDRGFNLIGVPIGINKGYVWIASVPMRPAARRFFDDVNRTNAGAFLLDENMTIMAASRPELVGTMIGGAADPEVVTAMRSLESKGQGGSAILVRPFTLGSEHFKPAIVSVQQVRVLDKTWYVLIASPLSDVNVAVGRLFRRALFWAVFVALCGAGILVSTAIHLIRTRSRFERERHELLERELRQAREIQLAWLPRGRHPSSGLDIATINHPASRISGDFYNWFELPDGRIVVAIGDVTGHGMSAAFLMATTQMLVRNTMPRSADTASCLEEINRQLCTQAFNGQFVTLVIAVLDPRRGRLEISSAGHPPPLFSDGESFQRLAIDTNLVLGVESDATYTAQSFDVPPTSALLLYTDGVCDVEAAGGQRFGFDRLRRCLYGRFEAAQDLVDSVLAHIDRFRGNYPLCDDLTMVAIQMQPQALTAPELAAAPAAST